MDYEPQESQKPDGVSPYSDYYSTGGRYRPPRRPRNYGWMVAVLGAFLLCIAGGVVLSRGQAVVQESVAQETAQQETATAEIAAQTMPDAQDTQETQAGDSTQVLGSGVQLEISEDSETVMELPDIYKKVIPSVVSITATSSNAVSTGTGIIMSSDGYIITNYHVVSGAELVTVLLDNDQEFEATRVGGDETSDLAVLKIEAAGLTPAEFGSSDSVEVGDAVVAIGDPLGTELRGTMTDGIICGLKRDVQVGDRTMTLMQTDAALNSGNSGGPLVNMAGQVIGINTMKISSYYTSVEGIGFAIPISTAKPIVDELLEKGYVSGRPAFGFTVETLSTQMMLFYDLPGTLCIRQVVEGSDAYEQGVEPGDIITAIDGTAVSTMDEFNTIKNQFSAGDTVALTIYHKGVVLEISVKLMDRADLE